MRRISTAKLIPGVVLLGWQASAAILGLAGQADAVLAYVPDPAWLVTLYTALVTPPIWLAATAIVVGMALISWALLHRGKPLTRSA